MFASKSAFVNGGPAYPDAIDLNFQAESAPTDAAGETGRGKSPFDYGRSADLALAGVILIAALPVLVLICLAIWAQDGGSPIFAHRRIGRNGRTFPCLKLRTMVMNADDRLRHLLESDPQAAEEWARDQKLRSDPRITPLGQFLRKSSLDELPQLINVMVGHMSVVGPRPIVEAEVPRYGRYFGYYCSVRPGITGLWQISGRNNTSYRRRVAIDTVYSRQKTVAFDFWIMGQTIPALLTSKGCY
ncbi:sugar transferase [Sphingobium boeckii]|uniref:Exopolysaccharide production protein ExoY n=1 Tax=Sphingobium boeckii TaxID=1082345 RepID=A0A7W9AHS4_9SPHN|nr:sugar transferase [Sphingobium boeckii]MBB5685752.1 exopolysaccharide production protein ExoY [Sphingobium boeckii]